MAAHSTSRTRQEDNMPQPDRNIPNNPASTPFSSMSAQLYPDTTGARDEMEADQQPTDGSHDPVHEALQQNFSIDSNQKQGGSDADNAISLVKDFALHQLSNKAPLTFDEAKNAVLNHVIKTHASPENISSTIPALVYTDMAGGRTWFHNPDTGENFEIQTRNAVTRNSQEGANNPYIGNITRCEINKLNGLGAAFGISKIYTTDNRQRWIHGGGSDLDDPLAPRQGWEKTKGCTRGQNEDVEQLCRRIQQWQEEKPGRPILYIRTWSMKP
jgi:hypothetical protein